MKNRVNRVIIVYKKTLYERYVLNRRDPYLARLAVSGQKDVLNLKDAHDVHHKTLASVLDTIKSLRIPYRMIYRSRLNKIGKNDLVVTVGGDGTLLRASHAVLNNMVLGVNSDPKRSEAVFCASDKDDFERLISIALSGRLDSIQLYRIRVLINKKPIMPLVLNDVLVSHPNPATMSRYKIRIGNREEFQKSSGIWVSTAAGSGSAALAAGGRRLVWTSSKFQYQPRELYHGRLSHPRLKGSLIPKEGFVEVKWLMRDKAAVFIDGSHIRYSLCFGDRIRFELSKAHPLNLLGFTSR